MPTALLALSFYSSVLPEAVKIGYMNYRVRQFCPKPLQCFRCCRFGHGVDSCGLADPVCCLCGKTGHLVSECVNDVQCVNCGFGHGARDRECKKYIEEVELVKMKVDRRVSMSDARKIFAGEASEFGSSPVCSAETPVADSGAAAPLDVEDMNMPAAISEVVSDAVASALVWSFVRKVYRLFYSSGHGVDSIFYLLCKFSSEHALAVAPYVCRFAECGSGGLT